MGLGMGFENYVMVGGRDTLNFPAELGDGPLGLLWRHGEFRSSRM